MWVLFYLSLRGWNFEKTIGIQTPMNLMRFSQSLHHRSVFMKLLLSLLWRYVIFSLVLNLYRFFNWLVSWTKPICVYNWYFQHNLNLIPNLFQPSKNHILLCCLRNMWLLLFIEAYVWFSLSRVIVLTFYIEVGT